MNGLSKPLKFIVVVFASLAAAFVLLAGVVPMLMSANDHARMTNIGFAVDYLEKNNYWVLAANNELSGHLIPSQNVTYDIGSSSKWWSKGYFNSIQVGGHNIVRAATLTVAANDSTPASKAQADYVCLGTNDHSTIQAILNAAPSGSEIKFAAGTYVYGNDKVTVDKQLKIVGSGWGTLFDCSGQAEGSEYCALLIKVSGVEVCGIRIYNSANDGITVGKDTPPTVLTNIKIHHNYIVDSREEGIYMWKAEQCTISDNYIYNYGGDVASPGIEISDYCNRNLVSGNTIDTGNGQGISLFAATYNRIVGNTIRNATGVSAFGIEIRKHPDQARYSTYNVISNNIIENSGYGIFVRDSCPSNVVEGNHITGGTIGINVEANLTGITGNYLYNQAGIAAIYIADNVYQCSITGNIVSGATGDRKLYIMTGANEISVVGNTFTDRPVIIRGTNILFSGNTVARSNNKGLDMAAGEGNYVTITGNLIKDNSGQGIHVRQNSSYTLIAGNEIVETAAGYTQNPGIQIDAGSVNVAVLDNRIVGHTTNLSDSGTDTLVRNNFGVKDQYLVDEFRYLYESGTFLQGVVPSSTEGKSGSGYTSQEKNYIYVATGTTASSVALRYQGTLGLSPGQDRTQVDFGKDIIWQFNLFRQNSDSEVVGRVQLKAATTQGQLVAAGIGLQIDNLALTGESYGTARGTVDLSSTLTALTTYQIIIISKAGDSVEFFVNGVSKGTITTANALPTGTTNSNLMVSIINGATGGVDAKLYYISPHLWVEF